MSKRLAAEVQIGGRFLRSVRLDADYGRTDVLDGFVLQASARLALDTLAKHVNETQQRAFTWTGPYGGGKSSLALALCSLVHEDPKVRSAARAALHVERGSELGRAFDASSTGGWVVIPVVGKRAAVVDELAAAINRVRRKRRQISATASAVIAELVTCSESSGCRGVLVVIDELGKLLEESASSGADVYFFQELAEAAARSRGKLVIIGVLHQSFEQYAARLGRALRDEWSKVQGRFVDISLAAASDEQIELIGKAIRSVHKRGRESSKIAETVARSIRQRRPGASRDLASKLNASWPLHPVTAALLGPSSKRRFGQNERSIFGFLNSVEPAGFKEFLENTESEDLALYDPSRYWDYLRTNLEPGILASADGHRWALGVEAVERAESKGSQLHVRLVKTIAVIDMFRNGSGLAAEDDILFGCIPAEPKDRIIAALQDLTRWSICIYRKHVPTWAIYAGSDFDIDAAVAKAREEVFHADVRALANLSELTPVLAKRLYQRSGAMHFLRRALIPADDLKGYVEITRSDDECCGEFILTLPTKSCPATALAHVAKKFSSMRHERELLFGVPARGEHIMGVAEELAVLRHVYDWREELSGDPVATREIGARIDALTSDLEEALRDGFLSANWYWHGKAVQAQSGHGLAELASKVATEVYKEAPVFISELINREDPSSSSVKARRELMHKMVERTHDPKLGYDGFSADAGLYFTVLRATTLHREEKGRWGFYAPSEVDRGGSVKGVWDRTNREILATGQKITLSDLYRMWAQPPFGIKAGVAPVLALAYYLTNQSCLAVYHGGMFTPDIGAFQIDEWLQDTGKIEWRYVEQNVSRQHIVGALSRQLSKRLQREIPADLLEVSRALVSIAFGLPGWSKRTASLSEQARMVRHILLKASDPHQVLFVDLATALKGNAGRDFSAALDGVLDELCLAYPKMLGLMETRIFEGLAHDSSVQSLHERGATVGGITGDFRLDAFAARLSRYRSPAEDMESLISLAVSKPPREWTDRDIEAAIMQLGAWCVAFRQAETLATLRNRPATRHALAVVFGPADGNRTISRIVEIPAQRRDEVAELANQLLESQKNGHIDDQLFLAALAEAGASIASGLQDERTNG